LGFGKRGETGSRRPEQTDKVRSGRFFVTFREEAMRDQSAIRVALLFSEKE
jgi:hypothetical protein